MDWYSRSNEDLSRAEEGLTEFLIAVLKDSFQGVHEVLKLLALGIKREAFCVGLPTVRKTDLL